MSTGQQRTIGKIDKIVTLYHRELSAKRPGLGKFPTQSVVQGLISAWIHILAGTSNTSDRILT
jgi:hypothetical protein